MKEFLAIASQLKADIAFNILPYDVQIAYDGNGNAFLTLTRY